MNKAILMAALGLTMSAISSQADPAQFTAAQVVTKDGNGHTIQTVENRGPRAVAPQIVDQKMVRYQEEATVGNSARNVTETVSAISANVGDNRNIINVPNIGTMSLNDRIGTAELLAAITSGRLPFSDQMPIDHDGKLLVIEGPMTLTQARHLADYGSFDLCPTP
jgi:hypothetical protein